MSILVRLAAVVVGMSCAAAQAGAIRDAKIQVFRSPAENIEKVDASVIRACREPLDLAGFVLTDATVLAAIAAAAAGNGGAPVRIYIDQGEAAGAGVHRSPGYLALAEMPNVQIRMKAGRQPMHLKSYACGNLLRSGSANFSGVAFKAQDNDLVLIRSKELADDFRTHFETLWSRSDDKPFAPLQPDLEHPRSYTTNARPQ